MYLTATHIILGTIIFLLIYLINRRIVNIRPEKMKFKVLTRCGAAAYLAAVLISFFFTEFSTNTGYKPDFWNQARGYHNTGSYFNFCLNTKYLVVGKPTGYDASLVADYVDSTLEDYIRTVTYLRIF